MEFRHVIILALGTIVLGLLAGRAESQKAAVCVITPETGMAGHDIEGMITVMQASEDAPVTISVELTGFNATDDKPKHGFHVHTGSSTGSACGDMLGHFHDGVNTVHGAPTDTVRHIGDLGNVEETVNAADPSIADVKTTITDSVVSLYGDLTIIGRGFVVHETFDDLGTGGFPDSLTTGHAGGRLGCCVIIETSPQQIEQFIDDNSTSPLAVSLITILAAALVAILKS